MKIENIKFKAKRLDNGEWIEGEISHFENTIWIVPIGHELFHLGCAEVDQDTICMFTGLKDCDGKFFPCVFKDSEDILATDWEEVERWKKKVLTLTVSKQWFDMIADGRKDEEYREIKPYWASRLVNQQAEGGEVLFDEYGGYCCVTGEPEYKPYTHVLFINGYRKNSPRIEKEIESITIGKPKKGMCPDKWLDTEFFIIKFK